MSSDALIRYDGDIGNRTHGWQFLDSKAGDKVYVPFEGVYESKGGRMQSPVFALDKRPNAPAYYSLTFKAKAPAHCYWWVDLFDAAGQPLPDINSAVYPGAEERDYAQMLYIGSQAAAIQMAFQSAAGVSVSDLVVKQVSFEAAARWCDAVYAELPPLAFTTPAEAFALLPETAAALKDGRPWRVVMLGDSIMNDSYTSVFQALIQRDFPRSKLEFIISVRGSTGCWFYREPPHFAEYVTRHKPDLLMIGGISHLVNNPEDLAGGMDNIRQVIRQAQALGCETLLMSPAAGADWRAPDPQHPGADLPAAAWTEDLRDKRGIRRLLWSPYAEVAGECGIAFWNMTAPGADYLAHSRKPHGFFNRDTVHNNDRGKQIIGRLLQRHFRTANVPRATIHENKEAL